MSDFRPFAIQAVNLSSLLLQAKFLLGQDPPVMPPPPANSNGQPVLGRDPRQLGQPPNPLLMGEVFENPAARLAHTELGAFFREVIDLPKDMRQLLLSLAFEQPPAAQLKTLLAQPLQQLIAQKGASLFLSPEDLANLLERNTKGAADKLSKLLQAQGVSQSQGAGQVAELMTTLGKLSEKIKQTPQQSLQTVMLLYLPFYPLGPNQKLEISPDGQPDEDADDGTLIKSVTLYLQTNAFGQFRIEVSELSPLQIQIDLKHEPAANGILPSLENKVNEQLAQDGLPAAVWMAQATERMVSSETYAEAGFAGATRQIDQQNLQVHQSSKSLSLLVLNIAYSLARFIFELDDRHQTLQR